MLPLPIQTQTTNPRLPPRPLQPCSYALLPHIYTLFLHANGTGAPIMRPLFYEFPADPAVPAVQHAFMLGEGQRGAQELEQVHV